MGVPTPQYSTSTTGRSLMYQGNQTVYVDAGTARPAIYAAPFDALAYNGMQINGAMDVSQEFGTSGTGGVSGRFPVDGISIHFTGTMVVFSAQFTDLLASVPLNSALINTIGTAQASLGAGDFTFLRQTIEGYRVARLRFGTANASPVTVAFWSSHSRTGTYSVSLRNSAGNRSCVMTYTQDVANVYEYKTLTFPGDTGGTWLYTNGAGLQVAFTQACGSTFTTATTGAWQAGSFIAATGQTNCVQSLSDQFKITGLIILPGSEAPTAERAPYIMRPYTQELSACQRYYRKIKSGIGMAYSANAARFYIPHEGLRATPTASVSGAMSITNTHSANYTQTSANLAAFSAAADYGQYDFGNFVGLTSTQPQAILPSSAGFLILDARM